MKSRMQIAMTLRQKIDEEGETCSLTGWPITPDYFELDHIVPLTNGGQHEANNIQFVHPVVNKAKGTMDNDVFIDMCKAVAINAFKAEMQSL